MSTRIVFNGKAYNSLEEMPEKERLAYQAILDAFADKNANGLPDLIEGALLGHQADSTRVVINNHVVTNVGELTPDEQEQYRQGMQKLDADGNGIPDVVEGMFGMKAPKDEAASLLSREPQFSTSTPVIGAAPDVEIEGRNKRFMILAALLLVVLCFGAAAMLFLLAR